MNSINKITTSRKELTKFGLVTGFIFCFGIGLLVPFLKGKNISAFFCTIGFILMVMAIWMPARLQVIYLLWMAAGSKLQTIKLYFVLGFAFYFIFFPLGICLRLVKFIKFCAGKSDQNYRVQSTDGNDMTAPY